MFQSPATTESHPGLFVPVAQAPAADAEHRLALRYHAAGEFAAAVRHLQRAAELDPRSSQILFNLATLLYDLKQLDAAGEAYQRCLAVEPGHFKARNNLAAIFRAQGRLAAAIEQFRAARDAAPDSLEVSQNLAAALFDDEQYASAGVLYEQLHAADPHNEPIQQGLALCLARQGRPEAAGRLLSELGDAQPHDLLANLARDLFAPTVFPSLAAVQQSKQCLSAALARLDHAAYQLNEAAIPTSACKPPLMLAYYGGDVLPYKQAVARAVARHVKTTPPQCGTGKPRVGFLATQRHEAVFLRGMAALIRALPTDRFEIVVITSHSGGKSARQALANEAIAVSELPAEFPEMVAMLRGLRLDVLYFWEIGTDPTNYFLPFYRTAPLQCTSWGWPMTSGLAEVDYFLSSDLLEPAAAEQHYSEQLIRFPGLPNVYRRPAPRQVPWGRGDFGLGDSEHIYLCPQNPLKITPDLDELFIQILRQDAAGRLLLLCGRETFIAETIHQRLVAQAPDVIQRVAFVPRASGSQYRDLLRAADVLLDTLHYGGGANTNSDALALAQPIVTLPTEFHRGRYTQAVYRRIGVTDTIAADKADYVRLALRLAQDRDFRHDVSRRLADRSELLFDDCSAVAHMTGFLEQAVAESRGRR